MSGYDYDVNHSWWVPDLGGKYDAIPGKDEPHVVQGAGGRRTSRAAPSSAASSTRSWTPSCTSCRAPSTTSSSPRARRTRAATGLGKEEWVGVCQKCHRLDHAYIGPALGGNPLLADRKGIETLLRNGRGKMPAVGRNWTSEQIDALISWTKQYAKGGTQ